MINITDKLEKLQQRIITAEQQFERTPSSVILLAISKTRTADEISIAIKSGQYHFGENYLQEAVDKILALNHPGLVWHFTGPVQSNKTRLMAKHFSWVHTVDKLKIAARLNDMRPDTLPPVNVCIQVNISEEPTKSGVAIEKVLDLADSIHSLRRVRLRGLMTMPQLCSDFEQQRESFRRLSQSLALLQSHGHEVDTLSMGTSIDLEAAIAEGATIIRIGTDIFGPRISK